MDYSLLTKQHSLQNRFSDRFIMNYASVEVPNANTWVTFKFAIDKNLEYLAAIGNEYGEIEFIDLRFLLDADPLKKYQKYGRFKAHRNAVMDLCFVPHRPEWLASVSGCSQVCIWDLNAGLFKYTLFEGHSRSVRTVSFFPHDSNMFASGGRDGHVYIWDLRDAFNRQQSKAHLSEVQPQEIPYDYYTHFNKAHPHGYIMNAHEEGAMMYGYDTLSNPPTNRKRRIMTTQRRTNINSITSLAHIDEYYLASASSISSTDIRIWDLRYQKPSHPLRVLYVPAGTSKKQTGICSLATDRFCSQLFAVGTDNRILVYDAQSNIELPMNDLQTPSNNNFQVQCATSPISDHLVIGSGLNAAFIYDLQLESHTFNQDSLLVYEKPRTFLPFPKYCLGGHNGEVDIVSWSCKGRYIATLDDTTLKIWDNCIPSNLAELVVKDQPHRFERPKVLSYSDVDRPIQVSKTRAHGILHDIPMMAQRSSPLKSLPTSTAKVSDFRSSVILTSPTKRIRSPLKKRVKVDQASRNFSSRQNLSRVFNYMANEEQEDSLSSTPVDKSISKTLKSERSQAKRPDSTSCRKLKDATPKNRSIRDYFSPRSSN